MKFARDFIRDNPDVAILIVVAAGLVAYHAHRSSGATLGRQAGWSLLLGTGLAGVLLVMCFFPALWAQSTIPPDRTLFYGSAIMVAWLGAAGWWIGSIFSDRRPVETTNRAWSRWLLVGAFVLLAAIPVATAAHIYRHQAALAQQAYQNDLLTQEITAARTSRPDVVVHWSPGPNVQPLAIDPSLEPGADPRYGINQCIAYYYGIDSLQVLAP
jgi:hypothetical protein